MATSNLDSADLKGVAKNGIISEDVMDKIFDISKIPLPFTDIVGKGSSKNSYKEWTTDELENPAVATPVVDGADASGNNTRTGERVGNHHQIARKIVNVSTRAENSKGIGFTNALSYQVMRRQQELRRNVETTVLNNQASVADDGANTAGVCGGLPAWIISNKSLGQGSSTGGFKSASGLVNVRTVGTKRGLRETYIRDVVSKVYNNGGDPSILMSVPNIIASFSQYLFSSSARVATLMSDQAKSTEKAAALGSINVFVTDFGTLKLVPNRLQLPYVPRGISGKEVADVFILNPDYLSMCYMGGYKTEKLAKVGLSERRQMHVDFSLIVHTEKAHGIITDIDIAAPATT